MDTEAETLPMLPPLTNTGADKWLLLGLFVTPNV